MLTFNTDYNTDYKLRKQHVQLPSTLSQQWRLPQQPVDVSTMANKTCLLFFEGQLLQIHSAINSRHVLIKLTDWSMLDAEPSLIRMSAKQQIIVTVATTEPSLRAKLYSCPHAFAEEHYRARPALEDS